MALTLLLLSLISMPGLSCTSGGGGHVAYTPANGAGMNDTNPGDGSDPKGALGAGGDVGDKDGGMLLGSGEAGPLGPPQALADWSEEQIEPWGPIATVHDVEVGGAHYLVSELATSDPFTPTYQLPSGSIVNSNRPLEELVLEEENEQLPPIITWSSPNGPLKIFDGEICVLFDAQATQQQIEQLIAEHDLVVIWSWFDPPAGPGAGNAFAFFQFAYDETEFPAFDDAWSFFNALPLVEEAIPSSVGLYEDDYENPEPGNPLAPSDHYYWYSFQPLHECQQIDLLGIDDSDSVPLGPESENGVEWFSDQVAAVVDSGVWRFHEDFAFV